MLGESLFLFLCGGKKSHKTWRWALLKLFEEERRTQRQQYEDAVRNLWQKVTVEKLNPQKTALGKQSGAHLASIRKCVPIPREQRYRLRLWIGLYCILAC